MRLARMAHDGSASAPRCCACGTGPTPSSRLPPPAARR
jgi:hypothetical protein